MDSVDEINNRLDYDVNGLYNEGSDSERRGDVVKGVILPKLNDFKEAIKSADD